MKISKQPNRLVWALNWLISCYSKMNYLHSQGKSYIIKYIQREVQFWVFSFSDPIAKMYKITWITVVKQSENNVNIGKIIIIVIINFRKLWKKGKQYITHKTKALAIWPPIVFSLLRLNTMNIIIFTRSLFSF